MGAPEMSPKVTFIVPCYKLAQYLPECVNSILSQTYRDFEILIMDDCSPDNTPEVAASFKDPRVKHVRNEPNLGHLRNYNKGIGLAQGEYIWLISADDCLRRPYVLQRYMDVFSAHPSVGYVFCSGVKLRNGQEVGKLEYSSHGAKDKIFDGREFLSKLVSANTVLAAAGMARKECYDKVSLFPLDMPWGGDWYLWCVFAIYYDVGYLAEPMACYREHEGSMTNALLSRNLDHCSWEDLTLPWTMKRKAEALGYRKLAWDCLGAVAEEYIRNIASKRYRTSTSSMTLEQFDESLCRNTSDEPEREWVRARVYAGVADKYYWQGDLTAARQSYSLALGKDPWMMKVWMKRLLLTLGGVGNLLRRGRMQLHQSRNREKLDPTKI